jgi:hypothetical protein
MSVRDDADHLRQLGDTVPLELVHDLHSQLESIGHAVADILPDLELLGLFRRTLDEVQTLSAALDRIRETIKSCAECHSGRRTGEPSLPPKAEQRTGEQRRDVQRLTREQISQLKDMLPPPVLQPNVEGRKTHGKWVDDHGRIHTIVSGQDEDSVEVWRILQERKVPLKAPPTRISDVEQKLAARMVREQQRHLEVVINNRPCPGRWGCDRLLPVILPAGYSLTVHGPNFQKTYTGGSNPW